MNLSQKFHNIKGQITKTFHQNEEEGELIGQVSSLGYYNVDQGILTLPALRVIAESSIGLYSAWTSLE